MSWMTLVTSSFFWLNCSCEFFHTSNSQELPKTIPYKCEALLSHHTYTELWLHILTEITTKFWAMISISINLRAQT